MPTDYADILAERDQFELDRDHDDDIRRTYTPVYDDGPVFARTLDGLFRAGDLLITDTGNIIALDLTVRRSGVTLYGTGHTLLEVIDEVNDQLIDHIDACNHLEGLGLDVSNLAYLLGPASSQYDHDIADLLSEIDRQSDVDGDRLTHDSADILPAPFITQDATAMAPTTAAVGEPIDTLSDGYILALLIPVREGRA